ncbi:hypothetical protein [Actinokineospora sp. NBRC 105648]|uniref:hypothetical protein n=1 Tax=Actinokineospora sp. NBRC 105648 TaxID=3032206 RepID=UPI0024A54B71|nr:hypothetical protein [Actinokineospora sp. NBRC 105648]GLZ43666.1 hypothetical protein Acsp05_72900 [Actinokineospora sp. NBRC 105648]
MGSRSRSWWGGASGRDRLGPADHHQDDHQSTATASAWDAGSAAQTTRLLTQATLDGRVTTGYRVAVVYNARDRASTAAQDLLDIEVPGDDSARLRNQAVPLLTEAVSATTDAARTAEDDDQPGLTAVLCRLERVVAGLGEIAGS